MLGGRGAVEGIRDVERRGGWEGELGEVMGGAESWLGAMESGSVIFLLAKAAPREPVRNMRARALKTMRSLQEESARVRVCVCSGIRSRGQSGVQTRTANKIHINSMD